MSRAISVPQFHILVVDDDVRIRDLLGAYLQKEGYGVTLAEGAEQAQHRMDQIIHDLIVLDVMMPGEDGLGFLKRLRASERSDALTPVIVLTAKSQVENRLEGLSIGADDYVAKPFDPRELVLRIQAVLKRTSTKLSATEEVCFGPWRFNLQTHRLFRHDHPMPLTLSEEALLTIFCTSPDQLITREALASLSGQDTLERSVDVQVNRLRRKIESDPHYPRYLQTVRHKGYILRTR